MHDTGAIRGLVAIVVSAIWLATGCGRTDVAGQPTTSAAPQVPFTAPPPSTTTTTVPAPPPRPIHPAVSSPAVVARIVPTGRTGADPGDVATWDRLAQCESGGNWSDRDSPTYRGGIQFSYSTWRSVGGSGDPADASKAEQITRGRLLLARSGWSPWPACSRRLGFG